MSTSVTNKMPFVKGEAGVKTTIDYNAENISETYSEQPLDDFNEVTSVEEASLGGMAFAGADLDISINIEQVSDALSSIFESEQSVDDGFDPGKDEYKNVDRSSIQNQ